jgi:hypothetical protein
VNPESVKETISRGVTEGLLAYVGKKRHGRYEPFIFKKSMQASDVEISDDVYIVTAEEAAKHVEPQKLEWPSGQRTRPPSTVRPTHLSRCLGFFARPRQLSKKSIALQTPCRKHFTSEVGGPRSGGD